METLWPKEVLFFQLEHLVVKKTFNFHTFNKINDDFVTYFSICCYNILSNISKPFVLNEDGINKAQFNC